MKVLLVCNHREGVGGISGQVDLLAQRLRGEGHVADLFSTRGSVWQRLAMPAALRRAARDYDLLHVHCCSGWGFLPAVLGIGAARRAGKRVVLTYHGGGAGRFFQRHKRLVQHWLCRTDANIVLSGFTGSIFGRYGIPYIVIPNIIETDDSHYRLRAPLRPRYVCTRAHEELYNIPCVLRAFGRVQAELPEATLTLVGDGSQHESLVQLAASMGLANVTFVGRVPNEKIYSYLDQSDVLLSAPRVDNMPVSLLEAMAAGLLIVSSRVGGVPYMVEDGATGLLFESDNDGQMAAQMLRAVRQQEESLAIIKRAHESLATYRWATVRDKIYAIYGLSA